MPEFINTRDTMTEEEAFDALIADEITDLKDNVVSTLGSFALYKRKTLQSIEMPSVTKINNYAMQNCKALESVKFAAVTEIGSGVFDGDTALESADLPLCTKTGQNAFKGCAALTEIEADEFLSIGNNAFENSGVGKLVAPKVTALGNYVGKGARMSTVDLTALTSVKGNNFNGMSALVELILRKDSLVNLVSTSAFTGTPIAAGVGYIYVPEDLVSTYKAASNWLNYTSQIKSIEDYPLAFQNETISDSWAEILAAEQDGTYSTKYSVGDIKYVDVGGTKLPMQIIAFDTDDLADDSGKAKITWLSLCLLDNHVMNPTSTSEGGWAESAIRTWLRGSVYPKIEATVRSAIKEVTKTYRSKSPNDATLSVTDTVWIPSHREVGWTSSSGEGSGPDYSAFFTGSSARVKKLGQVGSATAWWTRTASTATSFSDVSTAGGNSSYGASQSHGIALGFCT